MVGRICTTKRFTRLNHVLHGVQCLGVPEIEKRFSEKWARALALK